MIDALLGKTVDGYIIEDIVGRGGMATVYLGRQISINRVVAIKFLPRMHLNDQTYLQRFTREAKIVSHLEHRHVVPIHEYGEYEGQPYIVMRYMPAGSVDDLLDDNQPMLLPQILDIMQQVGTALDYAHSKDVLHRDLKPGNILMDESGGAYLTDFGIARFQNASSMSITTRGVVGTPSYMSPEQARGKPLDGRSDVYALGVMLFEMATGHRPFEGDSAYDIAYKQVTEAPPSPCSINPALTTAVETVIFKALLKQPDARYQAAADLLHDLQQAIENPTAFAPTERNLKQYLEQKRREQEKMTEDTDQAIVHPTFRRISRSDINEINKEDTTESKVVSMVSEPSYAVPAQAIPSVSQSLPPIPDKRKRRDFNPIVSMVLGAMLGCGLLTGILFGGFIIGRNLLNRQIPIDDDITPFIGNALNNAQTPSTIRVLLTPDTQSSTASALEATSQTVYNTLIPQMNLSNDATRTAIAENPPTPLPTRTPAIGSQADIRLTPTLRPGSLDARGVIVYASRRSHADNVSLDIMSLDLATGIETLLTSDDHNNTHPAPSPDGRWLAFQSDRDGDNDIYVMNSAGGEPVLLTQNTVADSMPAWSPDGQWIVYVSDVRGDGNSDLYRVRLDGSDNQAVFSNGKYNAHPAYSPDGEKLVFTSGNPEDNSTWELLLLDLSTLQRVNLTNNDQLDETPVFNPTGTHIIYVTITNNERAIAIMASDGTNKQVLFDSTGSDETPAYSPDGRYILFTSMLAGRVRIFIMRASSGSSQLIRDEDALYPAYIQQR